MRSLILELGIPFPLSTIVERRSGVR